MHRSSATEYTSHLMLSSEPLTASATRSSSGTYYIIDLFFFSFFFPSSSTRESSFIFNSDVLHTVALNRLFIMFYKSSRDTASVSITQTKPFFCCLLSAGCCSDFVAPVLNSYCIFVLLGDEEIQCIASDFHISFPSG